MQIYFNGHHCLASQLKVQNLDFSILDNAFTDIGSFAEAQKVPDSSSVKMIHEKLDAFAQMYCPVFNHFKQRYHWSILQAEYATDIVFKRQQDLKTIYDQLVRTAIHTIKPDNVATFLGRKLHSNKQPRPEDVVLS